MSAIFEVGGLGSSAVAPELGRGTLAAAPAAARPSCALSGTTAAGWPVTSSGPPSSPCSPRAAARHNASGAAKSSGASAKGTGGAGAPLADFRTLYDAHFRLVWSTLSRLGVREEDLMDLTQKVFLTAYLKLPGFEGRSRFSTWLWSISRRVAIAHRRSAPICREVATDPSMFEFLPEEASVTNDRESAQQAEAILAKLTDAQRVVFLLFEVDCMSGREIAALLGIPLGTVRSRLRYARQVFQREVRRLSRFEPMTRRQAPRRQPRANGCDQAQAS